MIKNLISEVLLWSTKTPSFSSSSASFLPAVTRASRTDRVLEWACVSLCVCVRVYVYLFASHQASHSRHLKITHMYRITLSMLIFINPSSFSLRSSCDTWVNNSVCKPKSPSACVMTRHAERADSSGDAAARASTVIKVVLMLGRRRRGCHGDRIRHLLQ